MVLDVMMPEMNGFDVAAVLKNDPATMDIPIIILSIVEDKERGFRIGVDRYLTKPIDTQTLFQEVDQLLEQGNPIGMAVADEEFKRCDDAGAAGGRIPRGGVQRSRTGGERDRGQAGHHHSQFDCFGPPGSGSFPAFRKGTGKRAVFIITSDGGVLIVDDEPHLRMLIQQTPISGRRRRGVADGGGRPAGARYDPRGEAQPGASGCDDAEAKRLRRLPRRS